jgi:PAS domain S-box-containing protein
MSFDNSTSREQLIQKLAEVRTQLAAKEQQCQELSQELTLLKSKKLPESERLVRNACRKLTARKQADEALRRLSEFPEKNPNPMLRVAADGALLYANAPARNWLATLGWQSDGPLPAAVLAIACDAHGKAHAVEAETSNPSAITFWVSAVQPPGEDYINLYGIDITERKKAEEALRESEQGVRRKLDSVLSPEGDLGVFELGDLIDPPALQKLMDDFHAVARIPMSILDAKGRVLVGVGWQDICTRFHRVQPGTCRNCLESDTRLSAGLTQGEYRLHKCRNNLWDMATPIIVAGQHVGNIFTGQFFFEDETVDRELFRAQALKYGFGEDEYLAALDRVPRLSRETVDRGMSFFLKLSDTLSQLGYSNVKLARLLAERDLLTDSLRESESFYRQTLESIPGMVFTTRPDGYCDYQSQQWVDYTGIPMSEHIGDGWNQLLHPDDRPRAFAAWRAAVEGLALYDLEYRVRRHDGTYEWFRVIARPIRDASGGIVRWFGVAMNIEGLKQVEQALRASEARFRSLAESNIIGVLVADPVTGQVFDANDEYLRIIGCSREELLAGTVNWRSSTSSEELSREGDLPRNRQREGRVEAFETTYIHRDGRRVPVIIGGSFLPDDPKKVVVFALDMTAHKMAEEALRQLNETLEQRVAERTQLAEGRAKQLQALAMELIETEERERRRIAELLHDDLQQILAAARMQLQAVCETIPPEPMLAGVEQLLEESIGKSRRLSHELSPAVLHHSSLVAALKWLAGQMMDQFGLQVQLESNAEKQVEIGPLKVFLFRAVQELLFNVVKHAGVKSAHVVLSGSDGSLAMMVSDQGQGFNPDILDSYTATRGFGLLSLRERARYIGGSLVIESAPGQGSRFTLTVPISQAGADEIERPAVDQQPLAQAGSSISAGIGDIMVLFVDDHAIMRQGLIQLVAGQPNIQVVGEAANGLEAIERVRQLKPDVVVMDVSMPEMDGIEATRRIRAEFPEVRVIGLSMYQEEQIANSMRNAGAEAFVSKTASPAELLEAIYGFDR